MKISFFAFNTENTAEHTPEWTEQFPGSNMEAILHCRNKRIEFEKEFPKWIMVYKFPEECGFGTDNRG